MALNVKRKFSVFGTRRKMASVTLHPFNENLDFSSILLIIVSVVKSKPGKITDSVSWANTKSI